MAKNAKIRPVTFGELPIIRATFGDMKLFEFHRPLVDMLYVAETVIDPPVTKMIGCISAGVLEEYDEATNNCKHHGYISKVAVRIFHRRRGLATRLITFVEDEMKQGWKIDYITVDVPKTNLEEAKLLFEHKGYTLANEDEDAYHFVKQFKAGETKGFCSHPETKKTLKRRRQKAKRQLLQQEIKDNGVDSGSSSQEINDNGVDSGSVKPKKKTKSSSSREKTKGNAVDSGSSSQEIKENGVDSGSVKPKKKTKSSSSQEKTKGNAIAT